MGREAGAVAAMSRAAAEVAELLAALGMDPRQSRVVAYLAANGEAKSAQLERACRLRQPEVSVATKTLRERGWVAAEERRAAGRGRPVKFYRLERPLPEIVEEVAERKRAAVEIDLEKVRRLRGLVAPPAERPRAAGVLDLAAALPAGAVDLGRARGGDRAAPAPPRLL